LFERFGFAFLGLANQCFQAIMKENLKAVTFLTGKAQFFISQCVTKFEKIVDLRIIALGKLVQVSSCILGTTIITEGETQGNYVPFQRSLK